MAEYDGNSVFMPGRGAVLIGAVGATAPTIEAVNAWVDGGATGVLGDYVPLGYTSIDELPSFDVDTEGGEKKGAWENDSLRLTRITSTDTVTITPIQWSETPLTHRFGPGKVVTAEGRFEVPPVYRSSEVSMVVVIMDTSGNLVFHMPKVASAPEGSIEFDAENFAGFPVKYTILVQQGQPKMNIILEGLKSSTETTRSRAGATEG